MRKRHPFVRDRIREFLAHRSIVSLIFFYIFVTAMLGLCIALLWAINTTSIPIDFWEELLYKWWYSFVFIYGYQPEVLDPYTIGASWVSIPLSIASVILPALLLGAFVFKIFIPRQNLIVYRDKISLSEIQGKYYLLAHCYIATNLKIINLKFDCYARTLVRRNLKNIPLRTWPLETESPMTPMPFPMVPTRIQIPVMLNADADDQNNTIHFEYENDVLSIRKAGQVEIYADQDDSCELIIIATGEIPDLAMELNETYVYRLPEDINFNEVYDIETGFDLKKKRVIVPDWSKF
jgi:hypothetical protein